MKTKLSLYDIGYDCNWGPGWVGHAIGVSETNAIENYFKVMDCREGKPDVAWHESDIDKLETSESKQTRAFASYIKIKLACNNSKDVSKTTHYDLPKNSILKGKITEHKNRKWKFLITETPYGNFYSLNLSDTDDNYTLGNIVLEDNEIPDFSRWESDEDKNTKKLHKLLKSWRKERKENGKNTKRTS